MWPYLLALLLPQSAWPGRSDDVSKAFEAHIWYGKAIAGLGDVDGDGYGDFTVSAPCVKPDGMVEARSGRSGGLIWSARGRGAFGWTLLSAGDVDRDGASDLVCSYASGGFAVLSGCDGARICEMSSRAYDSSHGAAVNGPVDTAIDVDADGIGDLLIDAAFGLPNLLGKSPREGALVARGSDGNVLGRLSVSASIKVVAWGGDADADGRADVLASTGYASSNSTRARLQLRFLSAVGASELWRTDLPVCLGADSTACRLDDVDADGRLDFAVGSSCSEAKHPGALWILSGRTGAVIHAIDRGKDATLFGYRLAATGDTDGDGVGDLLVTEYEGGFRNGSETSGRVHLVSGVSGRILWSRGEPKRQAEGWEDFGASVASIGDVDGDALPDVAVGAMNDYEGAFYPGAVHIFSGRDGRWLYSLP